MKTITQIILALAIIWLLILILGISLISVAQRQQERALNMDRVERYEQTRHQQ